MPGRFACSYPPPGDARFERSRLERVAERLNGEFQGVARLVAIRWETEFYKAHDTFQAQIPGAAQCDIVVAIFRGRLGGLPWSILGTTYELAGLVRADVNIIAAGRESSFSVTGVGEAKGDYFKNPVTGEKHEADISLPDGFIWKKGECGVGSFKVSAEGIDLDYKDTNWILYDFDWNNDQ